MRKITTYLSAEHIAALRTIALQRGVSRSQVIREGIDRFIDSFHRENRAQLLNAAFGIWADHTKFDLQKLRSELDRTLGP